MDMQYSSDFHDRTSDFLTRSAHNPVRNERERLDAIMQLVSTITVVAQSINSAYQRDSEEGDPLVACIVELSRRALAEVRAWPTRSGIDLGCDPSSMISHALDHETIPTFGSPMTFAPVTHTSEVDTTTAHEMVEGRRLLQSLTARELDMLKLIVKGMSNKEIACKLHLTEGTVKGYVSHMLSKINVADRTQAAIFAVRYGLAPAKLLDHAERRGAKTQRATVKA